MSGNVVLGYGTGSRGEFRLSSGSLITKGVSSKDGTGTLTFNGGTLRARNDGTLIANSANLTVTVGKKGGIIDTNGFSAFRGVCPQIRPLIGRHNRSIRPVSTTSARLAFWFSWRPKHRGKIAAVHDAKFALLPSATSRRNMV